MATPGKIAELDDQAQRRIAAALDELIDTLGIDAPPEPFPARQPALAAAYERDRFADILERIVTRLQTGEKKRSEAPAKSAPGETAGDSAATADEAKRGAQTSETASDGEPSAKPAERPADAPQTPHKGNRGGSPAHGQTKAGKR